LPIFTKKRLKTFISVGKGKKEATGRIRKIRWKIPEWLGKEGVGSSPPWEIPLFKKKNSDLKRGVTGIV